jgi:GDP-L-fucose synthase
MRVLLTGSTGMVGRNILEHSRLKEVDVLIPRHSDLNLLDKAQVEKYFTHHHIDLVIHAAGIVGGIMANINAPVRFLVDNTDMARNLIMCAYEAGVSKFINLGSSCMYPRNRSGELSEEMLMDGPLEPTNEGYALSKIYAARLCQYLCYEHASLYYKTLIPCNLFGRWDHFSSGNRSHLVASIFDKISSAQKNHTSEVVIWGTGSARREFMYASEVADAIFWSIDHIDHIPDMLNVGIGIDYSINEYYSTIADVFGYKGRFLHDTNKPEGMSRKLLNVSRLTALGWRCNTDLREGIRKTYEHYCEQ